jgi:hypothetical protein
MSLFTVTRSRDDGSIWPAAGAWPTATEIARAGRRRGRALAQWGTVRTIEGYAGCRLQTELTALLV